LPRETDSGNAGDWLWLAQDDLRGLRVLVEQETSYHLCISKLAEVTEKLLKAVLLQLGWRLAKIHDLQRLNDDLRLRDADLAGQLDDLVEALAERYFTDRYPGFDLEDPDWPELRELMARVDQLTEWVREIVEPETTEPTGRSARRV